MNHLDQYFELALDLPERERSKLLNRLAKDQPELAGELRMMLGRQVKNSDFACQSGTGGIRADAPRPEDAGRDEGRAASELDQMHHVAVQVGDIPSASEWYRRRFDCQVEYQDPTWALLRFGNLRLALVLPREHPPHFALTRDDAQRFGELSEHRDGSRSVYVTDPWGNSIEILDRGSLVDPTA